MASNPECLSVSERLGATPTEGQRSGQQRNRPAVVARWSKLLPVLRFTKLDKVFTYGIVGLATAR
jgi:hypothetical protein